MPKVNKEITINASKPLLSNVVVTKEGKLAYAKPATTKIIRQMIKDIPILCWYMLVGMVMLFGRSVWALGHRSETVTYKGEMLIYFFFLLVSSVVTIGLLGMAYVQSKSKLQSKLNSL